MMLLGMKNAKMLSNQFVCSFRYLYAIKLHISQIGFEQMKQELPNEEVEGRLAFVLKPQIAFHAKMLESLRMKLLVRMVGILQIIQYSCYSRLTFTSFIVYRISSLKPKGGKILKLVLGLVCIALWLFKELCTPFYSTILIS